MSIFDLFRIKTIKKELQQLQVENEKLKRIMQPEHQELYDISLQLERLKSEQNDYLNKIEERKESLFKLEDAYRKKSSDLIDLDEQIMLESFAFYKPKYSLVNSAKYKERLDENRSKQKLMIKNGNACSGNLNWTVNNNKTEGKRMVNDMIKLVLRSFNNECDSCVSNVKFNNIETYEKKIMKSFETLNKLGRIMQVCISQEYLRFKLDELYLAYEYQLKKQEEKEEQKLIREQLREEAQLQKEIEEARKSIEKERKHYSNALGKIMKQLDNCTDESERELLQGKIDELSLNLSEIEKNLKDIDYREANQKAGYVYIISNIGAFGEDVFKIGMTRRLDPYERVYELSDASVPFNFDVHAMIFSDNAPKLESALHNAFEKKKMNLINSRREFFNVTIEEIEKVVKAHHDKTIEFIKTADAEQYRESLAIRTNKQNTTRIESELFLSFQEAAVGKA
ncbi:DUF4041 domain-containing protein [Paenibacillus brevis]|uniref:DUF4041 domain-containing protein n=1 Tax=Paenibacillus brevis TaxID=2841508 RepID=A0ABS6FSK1_9BACL|nr:DUF4041 domain-containing protein [Paenibacillus brevis]MBU5673193.1 DUF4041 domain-containing protein [Paenibacillus brevis]